MNDSLTRAWIILGVVALLGSGVLATLVTGAKMPLIKQMADIEFIRWCLVVHVNLSTLIWFIALPVGLMHLSTSPTSRLSTRLSWAGLILSSLGVALLLSVPPGNGVKTILANYIPVLTHERYYAGIALYLAGVVINALSPKTFVHALRSTTKWPGIAEVRFGIFVGGAFLLFAAPVMALAFHKLRTVRLIADHQIFELGMWGGGHLIQHAVVVFTVCCWVVFLSRRAGHALFKRSEMFTVFAWLSVPLFFVPVILRFEVTSYEYHRAFTLLMQWGIAPPVLYFLFRTFRRLRLRATDRRDYEVVAFTLSAVLLLAGFIFGAFIRGSDMRVPGHYHASIGAVTLTFMAMSYLALSTAAAHRWILPSVWTYGLGQIVFAGGMFTAGAFGMPRKTYGVENVLTHWGQGMGLGMMAIGGLIALAGGVFFALAIVPLLRPTRDLHSTLQHQTNGHVDFGSSEPAERPPTQATFFS